MFALCMGQWSLILGKTRGPDCFCAGLEQKVLKVMSNRSRAGQHRTAVRGCSSLQGFAEMPAGSHGQGRNEGIPVAIWGPGRCGAVPFEEGSSFRITLKSIISPSAPQVCPCTKSRGSAHGAAWGQSLTGFTSKSWHFLVPNHLEAQKRPIQR